MKEEKVKVYDELISMCPDIERKGKTMPYTSSNGYMFTLLNKAGEIGIRFSPQRQEELLETLNTTLYKSYGAIMKGYVLIPENMFNNLEEVASLVKESYAYITSLEPNTHKKK